MTSPHGTGADGQPVDLIGQPFGLIPGPGVGIHFVREDDPNMTKATGDGVYTLDGNRYVLRKGDSLPEGAEVEYTAEDEPQDEQPAVRSKGAAPENRAKAE